MTRESKVIFVFGSNLSGRHGKGAALHAREVYGAEYGVGRGRTGNAYAIPTKNEQLFTRSLGEIAEDVKSFLEYADEHPELIFIITPIGCGLAGHSPKQIAPMFDEVPDNCYLHSSLMRELLYDETSSNT